MAAAAGQLFAGAAGGGLVIDRREILTSTARLVGAEFGELPLKAWMALVTLHVAYGAPPDGRAESTAGQLGRLIWGNKLGGDNTRRLVSSLIGLKRAELTIPGYDSVRGTPSRGLTMTNLLNSLHFDEAILAAFRGEHALDRREFGQLLGDKGPGTIAWQLNDTYVRALQEADLQRFDWTKVHQLRGVALALWLVFTSARIPYRELLAAPESEVVEVELNEAHCRALGVTAATDAARRRTFNEAGRRGLPSFLRVVRRRRPSRNGVRAELASAA